MKKIIFYIPAIFLTLLYAGVAFSGMGALQPIVAVWLLFAWTSGVLLNKNILWGGILGMIPAVSFVYLSTQYNGQPINIELPIGVILLLYHAGCMFYVYRKKIA